MAIFRMNTKSIKSKLVLFFLIATVIPTLIIGIISYTVSVRVIEEKVSNSSVKTLTHIRDNMEKQIDLLSQVADTIFVEKHIKRALSKDYRDNQTDFNYDSKDVTAFFDTFFLYSSVTKYTSSIILLGDNGKEFAFGEDAYTVSRDLLRNSELYKQARAENGKIVWTNTHVNWALIPNEKYDISIARLIKDEQGDDIGVMFISFKESAFLDLYKNIELGSNGSIFITDGNGKVISHSKRELLNEDLSDYPPIKQILSKNSGFEISELKNNKTLVAFCTSPKNGWKIIETMPLNDLLKESGVIAKTTLVGIIACLIMGFIFSLFISEMILRPIKKLRKTMRTIEAGDLSIRADDSAKDEIGQLSHSFNYMIDKMRALFEEILEERVSKKEAEYQALISQVNPHFLYNTLNSIKWMAIIQKSDSIKNMVSALGRLLQKSIKDIDKLVTISDELSMVEDYIYIQKMRYKDKFDMECILDEGLRNYYSPKFILQPIIENAIFHGLEPKDGLGKIILTVKRQDEAICFTIEDDGVGINEERIHSILHGGASGKKGFSAIGVNNVNERIRRLFGEIFGIKIYSAVGKFTKVEILIPLIQENREVQ